MNYSLEQALLECEKMYYRATDMRATGWETWPCKQDLYRVKFLVDELLEKCPTYSVEADWLREQEAEKIVRILKNEM